MLAPSAASTSGATLSWTGGSVFDDTDWSDAGNWSPIQSPATGDDLVLTGAGPDAPVSNDLTGVQLHSVTFSSSALSPNYLLGNPVVLQSHGSIVYDISNVDTDVNVGVTLNGPATITATTSRELRLNDPITGTGGLTLVNSSGVNDTLRLNGASSYTGVTRVSGDAAVLVDTGGSLPSTSAVTVDSGARLNVRSSFGIGSLNGGGTVSTDGFAANLTVGGDNSSTTFSGVLQDDGAAFGLSKAGTGTLTLTGANSYTGGTTVDDGTLFIPVTHTLGGDVTVEAGATLIYLGTIGGTITNNGGTVETYPGAATGVTAIPGDRQATVSWTAPASDGGSPIGSYEVTASGGGPSCTWTSGPLTCVVTGLTNGARYSFAVKATNGVATGRASSFSNVVTPATVPGAPQGVTATAGNARALVAWSAPGSNGGASVTGYAATAEPGGRSCSTSGARSCTVTGLTNGTSYRFAVNATNGAGTGPPSSLSNAVTPATVPGPPQAVAVTAGNAQAKVVWRVPGSNGGAAVTGYTATAEPGGRSCSISGALWCTVTGLTNGTSYRFAVNATNRVGTGSPSSLSNAVTPATVPGAPTGVSAAAGHKEARVSFTEPTANGAAISSYTVMSNHGDVAIGTHSPIVVPNLHDGTTYRFTVTAHNRVGKGPASAASNAVRPCFVCSF